MIQIVVPACELVDTERLEFINVKRHVLSLEHSLVSLSKWESRWCKPFLSKKEKTFDETIDYIRCMTITQNVDPMVYQCLTDKNICQINEYIEAPMTATWFNDTNNSGNQEQLTAELIYYLMITFNVPFECQKWHLNRLLTLIRVCDIKNRPPKKMSTQEIMSRNAALNKQRRMELNSKG